MPPLRRTLLYAGGALVATVVVGAGATAVLAGDQVPGGTRVSGIELGGLTRAEAQAKLASQLRGTTTRPVSLTAEGEKLTLDPVRARLTIDVEATAEDALSAGPVGRLRSLVGAGRDLQPTVAVDEPALEAELRRVAKGFDRKPREGAVRFSADADPVPVLPLTGRELDVDGAADEVRSSWPSSGRIDVPAEVTPVKTTEQDVQRAIREVAVPALAAPVTVTAEGRSVKLEPIDIAKALRIETDSSGSLAPRLDPTVLHERVRDRLKGVGRAAVDATFRIQGGKPVLVPSRNGTGISPADLATAVTGVLTDPAPRKAAARLTPSTARVTTERAKALGIVEQIGSFTSNHPCCLPRVENIHRIADLVDGYVLLPGEEFDLNGVVGPRDKARGFVEAPQILEGEFVDRVGGGVSQFATTMFNAVFFSGLDDITHTPHSYYITRYPPGREATVSFPLPDLVFENDSPHGVLITTSYTGTSITVTFWGTKRYDEVRAETGPRTRLRPFVTQYVQRADCTASKGEPGFDIVVTRVLVKGGRVVGRENFKTRYKAEPRFICGPPPAAKKPAPAPAPNKPAPAPAPSPATG